MKWDGGLIPPTRLQDCHPTFAINCKTIKNWKNRFSNAKIKIVVDKISKRSIIMTMQLIEPDYEKDRTKHFQDALKRTGGEITYQIELFLDLEKERELLKSTFQAVMGEEAQWKDHWRRTLPAMKMPSES
jgi:hypothetical protein